MNVDDIKKLREKGLTLQVIGDMSGVSRQKIWAKLHRDKERFWQKRYKERLKREFGASKNLSRNSRGA